MKRIQEDTDKEHRIFDEAVVDAYGEEERAMGWYYYAQGKLNCPFQAKCISTRKTSVLREGEVVKVIGMASEDECSKELYVQILWQGRALAVP